MTTLLFANNATGKLLTAMGGSDSTLTMESGDGTNFPAPSAGEAFYVKVTGGGNSAWMLCTNKSSDTLTVTRTDSYSFPVGSKVIHAVNATTLDTFLQKGIYRTSDGDPNGTAAEYSGEEILDTTNSLWYKHIDGTTWKVMSPS
jgi:hypothetical protein